MSRAAILRRVRAALEGRAKEPHPGVFGGWRPTTPAPPVEGFTTHFEAAGGEVERFASLAEAVGWIEGVVAGLPGVGLGVGAERVLRERAWRTPLLEPADAGLAISVAWGAVAETGSLVMSSRDGRRAQLLSPTHVVLVEEGRIHATLVDALNELSTELPSAVGLHSGPSKSADIGQVLVKGVHGPGRVIAVIVGGEPGWSGIPPAGAPDDDGQGT